MIAALLLATTPLLNLDAGQAYEIVSQVDCEVDPGTVDMNGAASTSLYGSGKKKVSFLFSTKWPASNKKKIGVLALEAQGGETTLKELDYNYDYVPVDTNEWQPPMFFQSGMTSYWLLPQEASNKLEYEEKEILVHGAMQTYKGTCEVRAKG